MTDIKPITNYKSVDDVYSIVEESSHETAFNREECAGCDNHSWCSLE